MALGWAASMTKLVTVREPCDHTKAARRSGSMATPVGSAPVFQTANPAAFLPLRTSTRHTMSLPSHATRSHSPAASYAAARGSRHWVKLRVGTVRSASGDSLLRPPTTATSNCSAGSVSSPTPPYVSVRTVVSPVLAVTPGSMIPISARASAYPWRHARRPSRPVSVSACSRRTGSTA